MSPATTLPFLLTRSEDVIDASGIRSTAETIDGLLRMEADRLVVQWRLLRETDRVGAEIRSDREVEPVQQVVLPLSVIAGASLRTSWWRFGRGARVVLLANDLRGFEPLSGMQALRLDHPAELSLRVRAKHVAAAREFVSVVELALAEQALLRIEAATGGEGR